MRRIPSLLYVITAALLAGGCWQSDGSLYGDTPSAIPFQPGAVTGTAPDGKVTHYSLTRTGDAYRLIVTDKGDGFGEGFELRFFPLSGLQRAMFVYEAVSLEHCNGIRGCDPVKNGDPRYYGLVRARMHGADEIRPDCEKDAAAIAPFGVKPDKSEVCNFTRRDTLEKSLRALRRKAPEYRYEQAQ
jgi:hypothetical protein